MPNLVNFRTGLTEKYFHNLVLKPRSRPWEIPQSWPSPSRMPHFVPSPYRFRPMPSGWIIRFWHHSISCPRTIPRPRKWPNPRHRLRYAIYSMYSFHSSKPTTRMCTTAIPKKWPRMIGAPGIRSPMMHRPWPSMGHSADINLVPSFHNLVLKPRFRLPSSPWCRPYILPGPWLI